MMSLDEGYSTVADHFESLQFVIIKVLSVCLVGCLLCFCFYETLFSFLEQPLRALESGKLTRLELKKERIYNHGNTSMNYKGYEIAPRSFLDIEREVSPFQLLITNPLEGFVIAFKTSFWMGILLTSPIWAGFIVQYVLPALHPFERMIIVPFVTLSFLFMGCGIAVAYWFTLPLANEYLYAFNSEIGLNFWTVSHYLSYTIALLFAHACAFEICLVLLFMVHFEFVSASTLEFYRRHVVVGAFVLGAILTPPDVLTQIILSSVLIGLYELALIYAKVKTREAILNPN